MLGEQHQDISRHLNDGIRYCQSLDRLSSWLYGSSMMIIFVFLLLIGFLATFGINHVIQTSAWLSFTLAVITMTSATFVLERRRRKVLRHHHYDTVFYLLVCVFVCLGVCLVRWLNRIKTCNHRTSLNYNSQMCVCASARARNILYKRNTHTHTHTL